MGLIYSNNRLVNNQISTKPCQGFLAYRICQKDDPGRTGLFEEPSFLMSAIHGLLSKEMAGDPT